eukprot:TRINITY_DN15190_c1_g1_i1.p1 TRINITY_DN15190_c1_g1~~TRINITY_DN15190_c1_g1_i1.p1  ORF type:complete len:706 (+),score=115.24 TRINITY_DN15190_c1_g1_i1:61-2118(+)
MACKNSSSSNFSSNNSSSSSNFSSNNSSNFRSIDNSSNFSSNNSSSSSSNIFSNIFSNNISSSINSNNNSSNSSSINRKKSRSSAGPLGPRHRRSPSWLLAVAAAFAAWSHLSVGQAWLNVTKSVTRWRPRCSARSGSQIPRNAFTKSGLPRRPKGPRHPNKKKDRDRGRPPPNAIKIPNPNPTGNWRRDKYYELEDSYNPERWQQWNPVKGWKEQAFNEDLPEEQTYEELRQPGGRRGRNVWDSVVRGVSDDPISVQHRILRTYNLDGILKEVNDRGDPHNQDGNPLARWSANNVANAWLRIAKFNKQESRQYIRSNPAGSFSKRGKSRLSEEDLERRIGQIQQAEQKLAIAANALGPEVFSARDLSTVVYAWGTTLYKNRPMVTRFAVEIRERIETFEPQSLSMIAYGLGLLGIHQDKLFARLKEVVPGKLPFFGAGEISNLVYGYKKLNDRDLTILDAVAKHVPTRLEEFECKYLSIMVYSMACLNYRNEKFLEAFCDHIARRWGEFKPQELANTAWALANLRFYHLGATMALSKLVPTRLRRLQKTKNIYGILGNLEILQRGFNKDGSLDKDRETFEDIGCHTLRMPIKFHERFDQRDDPSYGRIWERPPKDGKQRRETGGYPDGEGYDERWREYDERDGDDEGYNARERKETERYPGLTDNGRFTEQFDQRYEKRYPERA